MQKKYYLNTKENEGYLFLGVPTLTRAAGETTNGAFGLIEHWGRASGIWLALPHPP
jgi:hypothetical protein